MKGSFIAFFLMFTLFDVIGQDKCKPEVQYSVQETTPGKFSISLQSNTSFNNATLELVDLYTGKVLATKKGINALYSRQVIFQNLKPSLYYINISQSGCARTTGVGGKEGIKVGNI